jgi:transcriptional regulator of arginine metabolism
MNKSHRHFTIKEIIQAQSVGSQEELAALLKKRGLEVTQATLSRDLALLGIARVHTGDGLRYTLNGQTGEKKFSPIVAQEILSVEANEAMIVIRTLPGRAPGVASFLDSLQNVSILGTVAGDDTVFITPSSVKKISAVQKLIKDLLFEK